MTETGTIAPSDSADAALDASHALLQMAPLRAIERTGPMVVRAADGLRLQDAEGREYLDAFCGLMNVNVGYGRRELADVAAQATRRLSYASNMFGRTSPDALALADKLATLTPPGIERFFFSLGGSDAMDTAVKLVRHANVISGRPEKVKVVARHDSYHGMTLGATTMTGVAELRERVGPLLPGVLHVHQPTPTDGASAAAELESLIVSEGPETIAAFVGEPVALPPGVRIPPGDYWPAIREVCDRYDVKVIADEVVTGFGRTGRMFACEHWGLVPDVMTMAKGITSGYMPLGAVGIRGDLFEQLAESEGFLPHGFTAGGHPVACAVALANIEILERENLVANCAEVGAYLAGRLETLARDHASVRAVRSLGLLGAFDVDGAMLLESDAARAGFAITDLLKDQGILVRPYGNTIVFGVALTAARSDIDVLFDGFDGALRALGGQGDG